MQTRKLTTCYYALFVLALGSLTQVRPIHSRAARALRLSLESLWVSEQSRMMGHLCFQSGYFHKLPL